MIGLVNSSATKVNSYSYDPSGVQLSASETVANPWRYASGLFDAQTGLTKFGTRYYDPTLGRWTQRDPSGRDLPYAYAGDDPVNNTDPPGLGFFDFFEQAAIGLIVSSAVAVVCMTAVAGFSVTVVGEGIAGLLCGYGASIVASYVVYAGTENGYM